MTRKGAEAARRKLPPSLTVGSHGATDADGPEVVTVVTIERGTTRLMTKAQLLDYSEAHLDWVSYWDHGIVRWRPSSPSAV